ncbi:MAG: hypothetical protein AAF196_18775 [Planctomycetota bacterium]
MPEFLNQLIKQLRSIWSRMDLAQRLQIGSVALAAVVGLVAVVYYAGRPDDLVIHKASSIAELEEFTQQLTDQGIHYTVEGLEVRVPRDDIANRERLGGFDLPSDQTSLSELLSGLGSITADSGYRAAMLQDSQNRVLADKLQAIEGIRRASVATSVPNRRSRTVLRNRGQRRTAAVTLELNHGLDSADFHQLAGSVIAIVASAENLSREDVTVTDARTGEIRDGSQRGGTNSIGSLEEFEERLRGDEQEYLDSVLRPIKGVAGTVRVDFDRSLVDEERVLRPETDRVRSRRETIDPVATRSSIGDGVGPNPPSSSGPSQASTTEDVEYDTTPDGVRKLQHRMPRISGISVMLQISTDYSDTEALQISKSIEAQYPQGEYPILVQYLPADPLLIEEIRTGSQPATTPIPGPISDFEPESQPIDTEPTSEWASYLPSVVRFGSVLVVLAFFYAMVRRSSPKPKKPKTVEIPKPIKPEPEMDPMLAQRGEVERQFDRDPNTVSRVLESWLTEAKN